MHAERRRAATGVFFVLLALCFLARALVFLRPIANLDGLTMPDDCYYTLTLARSIARGLGPYTGIAYTNGFQPLFGFLMVPSFWLLRDPLGPVRVAIVVSALADTAALAIFGRLLLRQASDARVAWLAMFMWAVSPYAISNATNGLETSLAVCLILAAASYFPRLGRSDSGAREFFLFGLLGGLAMFARVDAGLLLAAAGLLSARNVLARGALTALRCGAATVAGVFLVNLPWWLFSYHYLGRVYPDSGRAIRELSLFAHPRNFSSVVHSELFHGVRMILANQVATLTLLVVAVVIVWSRGGVTALRGWLFALWQQQRLLVVFAAALFSAYTTYIFGYWFFFRYFYVISVVVLLSTALALDHALALLQSAHRRAAIAGFAALFFVAVVARPMPKGRVDIASGPRTFQEIYFRTDPTHRAWMNIGLWAKGHFPAGTVIGSRDSGALAYFADDLTVVNLDGVVNHDALEAMIAERLADYAHRVKIEYVLVWGGNMLFTEDLVLDGDLDFGSLGRPWQVYRLLAR